ncbi:unnamed protein product [Calypogeia fissa]
MAVVPAPGEYTVCEINRDLLTRKDDADKTAQDAYVKILGRVFSSIPFRVTQAEKGSSNGHGSNSYYEEDQVRDGREGSSAYLDSPVPSTSEREGDVVEEEDGPRGFLAKQLSNAKTYVTSIYHAVVAPPELQTTFNSDRFQAINWHKHKQWLAFISSGDQVLVYDFEDSDARDPAVLNCDSQQFVEAIEWRPNSGATLAVACRGGVCLWSASFPGNVAPVRPGVVSIMGTPMRGTGARWSLVDYLKSTDNKPVTSMSWSPNGRYPVQRGFCELGSLLRPSDLYLWDFLDKHTLLATASRYGSTITIWDAALGIGTPVRRGFAGISLLRWSPTGDYLFSAKTNGTFDLWETNLWTSEPWSGAGGKIVSAVWGPDGHVLVIAFDNSTNLGTIYFPSRPPSLDVHLLPLELPEIGAIIGGKGNIDKIAWDGTGERLAVSYTGGDATYSGLIAIFDTRNAPIVSTTFLGFIRGPGFGVKPLAFAFHNKLKQGALLAVSWSSGICCCYPLLFRAHK